MWDHRSQRGNNNDVKPEQQHSDPGSLGLWETTAEERKHLLRLEMYAYVWIYVFMCVCVCVCVCVSACTWAAAVDTYNVVDFLCRGMRIDALDHGLWAGG